MNYHDPQIAEMYDLLDPLSSDCQFYVALSGQHSCAVLDLGCGTGTLCCELARYGHRVTGVDPSSAMLSVAMQKPHSGKVQWVEARAQSYRSDRRFDLIFMTGHAFQILLTDADIDALFETMRAHIKDDGKIAFETAQPAAELGSRVGFSPSASRHAT